MNTDNRTYGGEHEWKDLCDQVAGADPEGVVGGGGTLVRGGAHTGRGHSDFGSIC